MTTWRTRIEPFTRPLFFVWSRLNRGMTLGVRAITTNTQGQVLLVKHTYLKGWWLPGGGVDRGETTYAAVVRELIEEAGVTATAEPRLISIHSNEKFFPGDHVAVFHIEQFTIGTRTSHGEIAEIGWFDLNNLPDDTTPATRRRLAEFQAQVSPSPDW